MSPEHHEERLRMWAVTSRRPVLSIDYGKAPECEYSVALTFRASCTRLLIVLIVDPYPFAIDEAFDTYRVLVESSAFFHFSCSCDSFTYHINYLLDGALIGLGGSKLSIIMTGDSA